MQTEGSSSFSNLVSESQIKEASRVARFAPSLSRKWQDVASLIKVVKHNSFFSERLEEVCQRLFYTEFEANAEVFLQGSIGDCMYYILRGEVEIFKDGKQVATRHPGDIFGEWALMHKNDVRSATVVVSSSGPCEMLWLDYNSYQNILLQVRQAQAVETAAIDIISTLAPGNRSKSELKFVIDYLKDRMLSNFNNDDALEFIAQACEYESLPTDRIMHNIDSDVSHLSILLSGKIGLYRNHGSSVGTQDESDSDDDDIANWQKLKRNLTLIKLVDSTQSHFIINEDTLMSRQPRCRFIITSLTECQVLKIPINLYSSLLRDDGVSSSRHFLNAVLTIVKHISPQYRNSSDISILEQVVYDVPRLYVLGRSPIIRLCRGMRYTSCEIGRDIDMDSSIYLLLGGRVFLYQDDKTINPGQLFGFGITNSARSAIAVGTSDDNSSPPCELLVIDKALVDSSMSNTDCKILEANYRDQVIYILKSRLPSDRTFDDLSLLDCSFQYDEFFKTIHPSIRFQLCKLLTFKEVSRGEMVYYKDQVVDCFYFLLSGTIGLYDNEALIASASEGATFGEWGFASDLTWPATARALSESCIFITLSKSDYMLVMKEPRYLFESNSTELPLEIMKKTKPGSRSKSDLEKMCKLFHNSRFFDQFSRDVLENVCQNLNHRLVIPAFKPIFRQGDLPDDFYILLSGECKVLVEDQVRINMRTARNAVKAIAFSSKIHKTVLDKHVVPEAHHVEVIQLPEFFPRDLINASVDEIASRVSSIKDQISKLDYSKPSRLKRIFLQRTLDAIFEKPIEKQDGQFLPSQLDEIVSKTSKQVANFSAITRDEIDKLAVGRLCVVPPATTVKRITPKVVASNIVQVQDSSNKLAAHGRVVGTICEGQVFGELALLGSEQRRGATILTNVANCHFASLDRETFNSIIRSDVLMKRRPKVDLLKRFIPAPKHGNSPRSINLDKQDPAVLSSVYFEDYSFRRNSVFIREGCLFEPETLWIVFEGTAVGTMKLIDEQSDVSSQPSREAKHDSFKQVVRSFKVGDFLNGTSVFLKTPETLSVCASSNNFVVCAICVSTLPTSVLHVMKSEFLDFIIPRQNEQIEKLSKNKKSQTSRMLSKLASLPKHDGTLHHNRRPVTTNTLKVERVFKPRIPLNYSNKLKVEQQRRVVEVLPSLRSRRPPLPPRQNIIKKHNANNNTTFKRDELFDERNFSAYDCEHKLITTNPAILYSAMPPKVCVNAPDACDLITFRSIDPWIRKDLPKISWYI